MAKTLPGPVTSECCPPVCTTPTSVQVPGPPGTNGNNGTNGTNGVSPFTTFTAIFTIPAELATGVATVADTSWMVISQKLYGARTDGTIHAFFEVTAIGGATSVTLKNLEDTPSSAYVENSAPGNTLTIGSKLCPAGIQGPAVSPTGAAGGDLKGTYPNPKIGIANAKGSSLWGNGTDTVSVAAGTNGHMLAYDSTDPEGVKSFKAIPLTGDANVSTQRVARLSATTGLPIPIESSKAIINNPGVAAGEKGALVLDVSSGNPRGTDAVDLQLDRASATQVASGARSFVGGGQNNTASSIESVVCGGENNSATTGDHSTVCGGSGNFATGTESFIGGGQANTATNTQSTVAGGDNNDATGNESFVGGGNANTASGTQSVVAGGASNLASGNQSSIGGGVNCQATQTDATVAGGDQNVASGVGSSIGGGVANAASGSYSAVPGGAEASANKFGQFAHAAGKFLTVGDAQGSEVVMRRSTTNATPAELFLDGDVATLRLTIPDETSWAFSILAVARRDDAGGSSAAWKAEGLLKKAGVGTTALPCAVVSTVICDGSGSTWGTAASFAITADTVNDSLKITVTGAVGQNIRWVAVVRMTEVGY